VVLLNEQYRMHPAISTWCTVSANWLHGACIFIDAGVLQMHKCAFQSQRLNAVALSQAIEVLLQQ
jgi:hypothetical protein